jgi:hypothetical protein
MSDPRGDPLARRAAEVLRREQTDERAIERVMAALRERANGDAPEDVDVDHVTPSVAEPAIRAAGRFSLTTWPALAAAAVIFAIGLGVGAAFLAPRATRAINADGATREAAPVSEAAHAAGGQSQLVEFVLVAPRAARVSLVGEFNGWDASATPMRHAERGDGTWSVSVPLGAGRHVYAFVIDNSTWVPDPQAPLAPEQWYGERNSVVVVSGGPRS